MSTDDSSIETMSGSDQNTGIDARFVALTEESHASAGVAQSAAIAAFLLQLIKPNLIGSTMTFGHRRCYLFFGFPSVAEQAAFHISQILSVHVFCTSLPFQGT